MAKQQVHVISHTHWDREWYMPYEKHHHRLIRLMDSVVELLERDDRFQSFHLDGQTIILDDYLQIHPDQYNKIVKFIQTGRLVIGPWYILQDEFLTSAEANVRNLQIGHQEAARYGPVAKVGYFPDSFGNMGQAPQILLQAGINNAIFGRGVKPTGKGGSADSSSFESPYSEMYWESPDGSRVLGVLFANWYNNGMEIPIDADQSCEYWNKRLEDTEKYASTSHLLLMNGCDHQPIQTDVSEALAVARTLYPDYEFIHSNFNDYCARVIQSAPVNLVTIRGELRSQRTDGWGTLVNTASARVYLKQANERAQSLLEKVAEPLATFAHLAGAEYPHTLLAYAWKTLMQNHPHDSICGCSVDEVHREMMTRFAKSESMTRAIVGESLRTLTARIDTSAFRGSDEAFPFVAFNTTGRQRSGVVTVELDIERWPLLVPTPEEAATNVALYQPSPESIAIGLEKAGFGSYVVKDSEGRRIEAEVADLGVKFGYELPEDGFRKPYLSRRVRVTLPVDNVPALGYRTYALQKTRAGSAPERASQAATQESMVKGDNAMENESLAVKINANGTIRLLDKTTGQTYENLLRYEDTGDIGNEYMYRQPDGEPPLYTDHLAAKVTLVENLPFTASYEIVHDWEVPASAEPLLEQEQNYLVAFTKRKSQRVKRTVPLRITTVVTLDKEARALKFRVSFDNQATDHRLRALFATGIESTHHHADSIYELAKRKTTPAPTWLNPSNTQHQHAFVAIDNENAGLAVANKGLNEYEALRDGKGTLAITLLRSVGELGDWGYFPTPEAQCRGPHAVEFALIPYAGEKARHEAALEAYGFQTPWTLHQLANRKGDLAPAHSWLIWKGDSLALTAFKVSERSGDLIARWFNTSDASTSLNIKQTDTAQTLYKSTVLEEVPESPARLALPCELLVRPAEIVTLAFSPNQIKTE